MAAQILLSPPGADPARRRPYGTTRRYPMKIREILTVKGAHVHTIDPDRSVLDAVALLVQHEIGALLVRDAGGAVAGIISERDVLRICRDRSAELGTIRVGDVMTKEP